MEFNDVLDLYVSDWNHRVGLHKIQIGLIGRFLEFLFGSDRFYFELESTLYNKYRVTLSEVIKYRKLNL